MQTKGSHWEVYSKSVGAATTEFVYLVLGRPNRNGNDENGYRHVRVHEIQFWGQGNDCILWEVRGNHIDGGLSPVITGDDATFYAAIANGYGDYRRFPMDLELENLSNLRVSWRNGHATEGRLCAIAVCFEPLG